MPINSYELGETITIGNPTTAVNARAPSTFEPFKNAAGVAVDPTTVTLTIERPDGTTFATHAYPAGTLQKESSVTGRYYADATPDQAGHWRYELRGTTGGVTAVREGEFYVRGGTV